jgi:serine/threonine-protein kinase
VLDFGISQVSSGEGQNQRLTRTGAVMGTPYYMSPEQIRDSAEIDQRTDVYGFGVILYETLTGRVPFDAESYSSLVLEIATGTPVPLQQLLPGLPGGLERVVRQAMAREQADRYPDVATLVRALEPFSGGLGFTSERRDPTGGTRVRTLETTTPFVSEGPPSVPMQRGVLGWVLGGAVLVVAAVLVGLYLLKPEPEAVPTAAGDSFAAPPTIEPPSEAALPQAGATSPLGAAGGSAGSGVTKVGVAAPGEPPEPAPPPPPKGTPAADPPREARRPSSPVAQPAAPAPPPRPSSRSGRLRADEF